MTWAVSSRVSQVSPVQARPYPDAALPIHDLTPTKLADLLARAYAADHGEPDDTPAAQEHSGLADESRFHEAPFPKGQCGVSWFKASNGRQPAAELAYTSGMKKLGWLLFCALVSSGLALESSVTIAGTIPGTLSLPDNASGKLPAVLLLHGFASQKDEVGDMYKNLAAKLATQGIASLRIDFQGSGDSKILFEQMTFTNQVSDAQAAFNFLRGRPEVDAARLGLLGFSMGGGVAIKLAANAANPVKSLALWSSTSSRSLADIEAGSRATAEKEGVVDVDLGFTKIKLGKAFYSSLQNQNLEADIGKFRGNTMIVYGTADPLSGNAPYFLYNLQGKVQNLVLINGADHIYHVLTDDKTESNQVIDTTANWFRGL